MCVCVRDGEVVCVCTRARERDRDRKERENEMHACVSTDCVPLFGKTSCNARL